MNQVIEDLKGNINWSVTAGYSLFQWIALIITLSGLVVASALVIRILWKWTSDFVRRKFR
jgi:hypothetical protein